MVDFSVLKTPFDIFKYINEGKNYKMAHKKQYYVWCCKPKTNVMIEGKKLESNEYIISGLKGEQRICTYEELKKSFVTVNGAALTKDYMNKQKKNGETPWFLLKTAVSKETYWGMFLPMDIIKNIPTRLFLVVDNSKKKYIVEPFNNLYRIRRYEDGVVKGNVTAKNIIDNMRLLNGESITEDFLKKKSTVISRNINKKYINDSGMILLRLSDDLDRINLGVDYKLLDINTFALAYNNKGWGDIVQKGLKQDIDNPPKLAFASEDEGVQEIEENSKILEMQEGKDTGVIKENKYHDIVVILNDKSYYIKEEKVQNIHEKQMLQKTESKEEIQRLTAYNILNEISKNYIEDWKSKVPTSWRGLSLDEICNKVDEIWQLGRKASEELKQEGKRVIDKEIILSDLAKNSEIVTRIIDRITCEMLSQFNAYILELVEYKLNKYEDLYIHINDRRYEILADKMQENVYVEIDEKGVNNTREIIKANVEANAWALKQFLTEILDEISSDNRQAIEQQEGIKEKNAVINKIIDAYSKLSQEYEKVVDNVMQYYPFSRVEALYEEYRKILTDIDLSWVDREIEEYKSKLGNTEEVEDLSSNTEEVEDLSSNIEETERVEDEERDDELIDAEEKDTPLNASEMPQNEQQNSGSESIPPKEENALESVLGGTEVIEKPDVNVKRKIQDFGEKIGGAKKDLWKIRGLGLEDLATFNEEERKHWVTKQNVWPKPDYDKMMLEGKDKVLVYYQKLIRDACPVKPIPYSLNRFIADEEYSEYKDKSIEELYILFIQTIREITESLETIPNKSNEMLEILKEKGLINIEYRITVRIRAGAHYTNKLNSVLQYNRYKLEREIKKKKFGYSEEEKMLADYTIGWVEGTNWSIQDDRGDKRLEYKPNPFSKYYYYSTEKVRVEDIKEGTYFVTAANSSRLLAINLETRDDAVEFIKDMEEQRKAVTKGKEEKKKALKPQMLSHIERIGEDVIKGELIDGESYLKRFKFRGGEFGNWLNDKERQGSLDYGYEAFCDLADILGITDESISFDGQLAIAFGARGSGNALAHYESLAKVINLTKMRGAGSLAHEWMHGLDNYIGKVMGSGLFESDYAKDYKSKLSSFAELVKVMCLRPKTDEEKKRDDLATIDRCIKDFKRMVDSCISDTRLGNDADKIKIKNRYVMELIKLAMGQAPVYESANKWLNRKEFYCDKLLEFFNVVKKQLVEEGVFRATHERYIGESLVYLQAAYTNMQNNAEKVLYCNTKFYEDAKKIDGSYSKAGHNGYWQSIKEMFARAGASYIRDKLEEQGRKNDYLCGHSEMPGIKLNTGEVLYTSPQGEERKVINEAFDKLFEELKEKGILKRR